MRKALLFLLMMVASIATFAQSVPGTTNFPTRADDDTSLLVAKNLVSTTLAGAISNSATSLQVADGTKFPSTGGVLAIDAVAPAAEVKAGALLAKLEDRLVIHGSRGCCGRCAVSRHRTVPG